MSKVVLSEKFLAPYRVAKDPFKSLLARSTYLGKYKRLEDADWTDTIARVVRGNVALDPNVSQAEAEILFDIFWHARALPPGRGLWTGGVPNIPVAARYNCHAGTLRSYKDWCWVADMLMCGGGVGVGLQEIEQLPSVLDSEYESPNLQIVCRPDHPNIGEFQAYTRRACGVHYHETEDSREGWIGALEFMFRCAFNGISVAIDVSKIRPRGTPIKTFGGIACGPGPLVTLLRKVWDVVRGAKGRKLTSVECLDITNHIGVCIKSGNVRRSALIVLGKAHDQAFRDAKKDWDAVMSHRHSSNNSIVFETEEEIRNFNWRQLIEDNATYGEPGLLNLHKIRQTDPGVEGINPCFRADTRVHTRQGHFEIKDLVGKTVDVWDGDTWRNVHTFQKTSENEPMLRVTLQDGSSFSVTHYHILVTEDGRRIEAKDIKVGERLMISNAPQSHGDLREPGAYLKGFLLGDGSASERPLLWVYPPKYGCEARLVASTLEVPVDVRPMRSDCETVPRLSAESSSNRRTLAGLSSRSEHLLPWCTVYKTKLPKHVFALRLEDKCELLAGIFDADGTAMDTKNGFGYQLSSVERQFLLDVQELLKTIGVFSKLSVMKPAGEKDFGDGYGPYETKESYRLTVSQASAIVMAKAVPFVRLASFADRTCAYKVKPKFNQIVSVEADGVDEEVYCLVTDDPDKIAFSNGLIIGRCGEIPLHDREACCLSEVYPAKAGNWDIDTILRATTRYTLRQRLEPMHDPRAEAVRKKNMRIGVGLGGICDFEWDETWLSHARDVVQTEAFKYADELGVSRPIATTTVKPSGTISLLNDSSPGIHAPFAPYFIRRTRIAKDEPMAAALADAGVPHEPCIYDSTGRTLVFSFPMRAPHAQTSVQTQTVREQVERQLAVQRAWADNAVSSTISFESSEKDELAAIIEASIDQLKSVSCLPKAHGYAQPPYEPINEETYNQLHAAINHDHPLALGGELETEECEGGVCPIK